MPEYLKHHQEPQIYQAYGMSFNIRHPDVFLWFMQGIGFKHNTFIFEYI